MSRLYLFILSCTLCSSIYAQHHININSQLIDSFLLQQMNQWKIPGAAIAIVKADQVLYAKAYGYRDLEQKLPVTTQTIFKIASLTKSFTAATAGILVNKKILDWDRPVKYYLPQLELSNTEITSQVNLRDLLNHRVGIYDDDWSWVGDHINRERMFEILKVMPRHAAFRSSYNYSNMGYALTGELMATQTNTSWRNLVKSNFFQPLGMRNACFSHNENSGVKDYAVGYEYTDSSFVRGDLCEHMTDSLSVCEAFGFISASVEDLSKWVQLFINGGKWEGKELIPRPVFRELVRPVNYMHPPMNGEFTDSYYAMGWEVNTYKGRKVVQHSGGLRGFKSYMSFMPEDSIGIIVLTNGDPYIFPFAMSFDLYDLTLQMQSSKWLDKFRNAKRRSIEKQAPVNIPNTRPSKELHEYAGTYRSQWLGDMRVILEDGKLYFIFHNYPKELMKHAHYDTFYTEAERSPGSGISFQLDHDGKVKRMVYNEFVFDKVE